MLVLFSIRLQICLYYAVFCCNFICIISYFAVKLSILFVFCLYGNNVLSLQKFPSKEMLNAIFEKFGRYQKYAYLCSVQKLICWDGSVRPMLHRAIFMPYRNSSGENQSRDASVMDVSSPDIRLLNSAASGYSAILMYKNEPQNVQISKLCQIYN